MNYIADYVEQLMVETEKLCEAGGPNVIAKQVPQSLCHDFS